MSEKDNIYTSRLILRPLQISDGQSLHCIYQADGILRYFPNSNPPPLEKVERFLSNQIKHWSEYGYGNWAIQPKGDEQIIGWACLQFLLELNETEVGFLLNKPYWGKGYATEAALASLRFGFEKKNLQHIIGLVHPDNYASRRVLEKCGMLYHETIFLWGINLMRFRLDANEHGLNSI